MTLANSQAASRDNSISSNNNINVCTSVLRFAVVVRVFRLLLLFLCLLFERQINSSSFDSQQPETNHFIATTTPIVVVVSVGVADGAVAVACCKLLFLFCCCRITCRIICDFGYLAFVSAASSCPFLLSRPLPPPPCHGSN